MGSLISAIQQGQKQTKSRKKSEKKHFRRNCAASSNNSKSACARALQYWGFTSDSKLRVNEEKTQKKKRTLVEVADI